MTKYNLIIAFGIFVFCFQPTFAQDSDTSNPFEDKMINVLFDRKVGKELNLVEEQVVEMKTLLGQLNKARKDFGQELKQLAQSSTKEELQAVRMDLQEQFDAEKVQTMTKVREVLVPEQIERLGQITAQLMMAQSAKKSGIGVLAPEMIKLLKIDKEQQIRIREKGDEVRKRLAEKIKRLTEEAREELMDELTAEQIDKYKKLVGDPIEK